MSDESDGLSALVQASFFVVDAWAEYGLTISAFFTTRRRALSSGSARYELRFRKAVVGWIDIRAITETRTSVRASVAPHVNVSSRESIIDLCRTTVSLISEGVVTTQQSLADLDAQMEKQIQALRSSEADAAKNLPPPERESHEPPARDAPIDGWLNWRDAELERGRAPHSVSYKKLAEQSKYSESQLKRAGAARKRTKNRTEMN